MGLNLDFDEISMFENSKFVPMAAQHVFPSILISRTFDCLGDPTTLFKIKVSFFNTKNNEKFDFWQILIKNQKNKPGIQKIQKMGVAVPTVRGRADRPTPHFLFFEFPVYFLIFY